MMRKSPILLSCLCLATLFFISPTNTQATTIYIGDVDGFGYGDAAGYVGADDLPAERNGNGVLDSGDALPDRNANNCVATGCGDDFDYRSTAEASATNGAQWTDVALSTSFSGRPGLANDASFTFSFMLDTSDPSYGQDHFINLVYGDYDVVPMTAVVEGVTVNLLGNVDGGVDGFIWRAYAPVSWNDMLDGQVVIDINAPNEPYVTFDYALLDTKPINPTIPEPTTLILLSTGLGALGFVTYRRKRK